MAEENNLNQAKEVVLGAYPSCEDCLAWSDDGLAVACGQNVYILNKTLKRSLTSSQVSEQWSSIAVRTDRFNQDEWPEQSLASLHHLSIGEEQSESVVVGLSWSWPGLGFHRRSVLAVLTSNLILSIWETDGSQCGWRRTCILNQHLPRHDPIQTSQDGTSRTRRRLRIRAFAWSQPLLTSPTARWGDHYIAVVDDDNNFTLLSINKRADEGHGQWSIIPICTTVVASSVLPTEIVERPTNLQRMIVEQSPVKRMAINPWHIQYAPAGTDSTPYKAESSVRCEWFHNSRMLELSIEISSEHSGVTGTVDSLSSTSSQPTPSSEAGDHVDRKLQDAEIVHSATDRSEWHEALKQPSTEFDRQNHLDGLFRVRFWGLAKSPNDQAEAACITIHPWDTYEYTSAVHEKSRIIFRRLSTSNRVPADAHRSEDDVLESTSKFIARVLSGDEEPQSALDAKLLQAFYAWASLEPERAEIQRLLGKQRRDRIGTTNSADDVQVSRAQTPSDLQPEFVAPRGADMCGLCGSQIPFTTTTAVARCQSGHPFSRCSLSLLSIQEPGISKYCAVCERQFLDISKLGPQSGQSVLVQLFDEFDTCPYCDGKYRG